MDDLFETKELAEILGVHPRKVGQALTPALDKLERLMRRSPGRVLILLGRHMLLSEQLERQRARERQQA